MAQAMLNEIGYDEEKDEECRKRAEARMEAAQKILGSRGRAAAHEFSASWSPSPQPQEAFEEKIRRNLKALMEGRETTREDL